jgi:hypothetical protein
LGLPVVSQFTLPPQAYHADGSPVKALRCFHCTLANMKDLIKS